MAAAVDAGAYSACTKAQAADKEDILGSAMRILLMVHLAEDNMGHADTQIAALSRVEAHMAVDIRTVHTGTAHEELAQVPGYEPEQRVFAL